MAYILNKLIKNLLSHYYKYISQCSYDQSSTLKQSHFVIPSNLPPQIKFSLSSSLHK